MQKKLRIGMVLPAVPGYSETFFRAKIKGLQDAGHEVILFAGRTSPDFQLCRVIHSFPVYGWAPLQAVVIMWGLLRLFSRAPLKAWRFYRLERQTGRGMKKTIENLYLNSHILPLRLDWLHFGFATTALRRENTALAMGAKMAVSLRGYDIALYPLKHPGCYHLLWQKADKVHTISDDLLALAYQQGLPSAKPVVKITPAIDTQQFHRSTPTTGIFNKPIRILTVARLHWKKGLEYTLEALANLKSKDVDFQYTLIGDGEEYERLVFAAHQFGIREQVHFAGKMPHEEVKAAMEQSDIYLQYSISEGFCNAVLEAQAMGLLCIVSDAEGLPENVLHGETGWVVPRRHPELLADQIEQVMQLPPEQHQTIRQRAIQRVREEFNIEKQIEAFLQFYTT
jgi:colanic acid/amylovoran biosynthesis glycosyltransferase